MNIALTYNVKRNDPSLKADKQSDIEFDSPEVTRFQKKTLESLGHKVFLVEATENAFFKLKRLKGKIDIVFNVAEGLWGEARETQIPIICEILKIPYTHSGPTTASICLDKSFTKLIVKGADGINVPNSHVLMGEGDTIPSSLKYPLIVKPNAEGSGKGVMDSNVVKNKKDIKKVIKKAFGYTNEVLVEEYIDGREFTVAVMGNGRKESLDVLPIVEQRFDFLPKKMNRIASYELKWFYEDKLKDIKDAYNCPAKLDKKAEKNIIETSREIYCLLDVKDCARIDYRMDKKGKLYFIEINTLPGINPSLDEISYFPIAARVGGMDYKAMMGKILELACGRYNIKTGK